jgi:hypothetical protein
MTGTGLMKMKSAPIALLAVTLLAATMIGPIHANYSFNVYARTDKASYVPGDSGTLYITIKNIGSQSFTVKNITVDYPWMAFIIDHWDGNFTNTGINGFVTSNGGTWNTQYSFTVPSDSRVYNNQEQATIIIGTDIPNDIQGLYHASATIAIAGATYQPLDLTTSLLPVVSIVLIAAAVVMLALVYMALRKQSKK